MSDMHATPDDLRATTMTAENFMDEVLEGTMHRSSFFFLPISEQNKVTEFALLLSQLIREGER